MAKDPPPILKEYHFRPREPSVTVHPRRPFLGAWAPELGAAASDSPFPTLDATARKQVLGRHLHVDMPIGENADPVRNGFHSSECLEEQGPPR